MIPALRSALNEQLKLREVTNELNQDLQTIQDNKMKIVDLVQKNAILLAEK